MWYNIIPRRLISSPKRPGFLGMSKLALCGTSHKSVSATNCILGVDGTTMILQDKAGALTMRFKAHG